MNGSVVVGLDGTAESAQAAEWAAREALLRETHVHLVHAEEPPPAATVPLVSADVQRQWAESLLSTTAAALRERHPGLSVTTRLLPGGAVSSLVAVGDEAELLVLGSRALGGVAGFVVGSVGLATVALVERPVVMVRAGDMPGAGGPHGAVVVGVDVEQPGDAVLGFAFEEAARHGSAVRALHAQQLPLYLGLGPLVTSDPRLTVAGEIERTLAAMLEPWRAKYPEVEATSRLIVGSAGQELVREAAAADLVVVGRRTRRSSLGPHLGHVAHAVLHHSRAPVAVVAHD
ncbi:universal stress protein [Streptomyces vilmorinianum]|uniref:universal stress protein n=1 Tax=Streptomyces vilmorinianum TaxID=3051092 RepID=UPI0010FB0AD6|nr:universal stress protein [Streptomyces vilmorinianum]